MKNLKYTLFTAALSVAMTAGFSSCSDSFLDEKNKSSYTTDYFKTSQGIQDLATALYGNIRSEERRVGKECRSRWSPYH